MKPYILHIAEVGLRVNDLPRMTSYYQDMLGFETELSGPNHVFLKVGELHSPLGDAGHPQMLVLFDRDAELDSNLTTLDHLAFEIPSDRYVEELERFRALGCVLRERTWPDTLDWRARSFFFRDPEGNVIELIAHDPEAA